MPTSKITSFTDPDELTSAVRGTDLTLSITQRGAFTAELIRIDLHTLWMQRGSDSLARVRHHNNVPGRAMFSFVPRSRPSLLVNGMEQSSMTILRSREAGSGVQVSTGPAHIASMSLPIADIEALGATYGDGNLTPPRDTFMTYPAATAMERLHRLHEAAGYLAEHTPDVIANPEAARGLEQALVGALADCLGGVDVKVVGCASRPRARLMQRLQALLESNPEEVFHVPEICKLLGTSSRTLTTCCNEVLGMSPHRYFRVRQLNLAHRALTRADPKTRTVTEIATNHGFWELGRFAGAYRALFGETPSATLQRGPDAKLRPSDGMKSLSIAGFA